LREPETWHLIATSFNQIVAEKKMTKVMTTGFLGNCRAAEAIGWRQCRRFSSVSGG
jgi:DNA-binding transcriptional regulator of glucitol operon